MRLICMYVSQRVVCVRRPGCPPSRYDAGEQHGRQVAKKGVRFLRFPPVLNVHLKRFEYEMTTGTMVKVNDRFSFPREMDIDQYLGEVSGFVVVGGDRGTMVLSLFSAGVCIVLLFYVRYFSIKVFRQRHLRKREGGLVFRQQFSSLVYVSESVWFDAVGSSSATVHQNPPGPSFPLLYRTEKQTTRWYLFL